MCGVFSSFCSLPPTLCFPLCISVTGACFFFSRGRGGSWLGCQVCQPSVQSPSWSWLPIVEAPGCVRHPTSKQQRSCLYIMISFLFSYILVILFLLYIVNWVWRSHFFGNLIKLIVLYCPLQVKIFVWENSSKKNLLLCKQTIPSNTFNWVLKYLSQSVVEKFTSVCFLLKFNLKSRNNTSAKCRDNFSVHSQFDLAE